MSGGNSHQRKIDKKAKERIAEGVKAEVIKGLSMANVSTAPPSKNFLQRLLDFAEQPLFTTSVGIVGGLVGLFYPPVFLLCGLCVVLAFHRARVVADKSKPVQIAAFIFVTVIIVALLLRAHVFIDHKLAESSTSLAQLITDSIKKMPPAPTSPSVREAQPADPTPAAHTSKLPPNANTSDPINPGAANQILRELKQLEEEQARNHTHSSFLISLGGSFRSARRDVAVMYSASQPLTDVATNGPIHLRTVNMLVYGAILNQQPVPTMIDMVEVEIKRKSGKWDELERVSSNNLYWSRVPRQFVTADGNVYLDKVLNNKVLSAGEVASGWMVFRYPQDMPEDQDSDFANAELRMTVTDAAGNRAVQVSKDPKSIKGNGVGSSILSLKGSIINVPREQVLEMLQ